MKKATRHHVGTVMVLAGLVSIMVLLMVGFWNAAYATPGAHKDYVCKYVGKPGVNERLQTGQNPIWVDSHATQGTWFNDKQGRSYVLIANTPRLDPEPSVSQCPPVDPVPTGTTTSSTSSTTTTSTPTTTATEPPTTTTTVTTTTTTTTPSSTTTAVVPPVFTPPVFTPPINVTHQPVPRTTTAPPRVGPALRDLSAGTLAYTGSNDLPLLAVAAGLILLGLALLIGQRVLVTRRH